MGYLIFFIVVVGILWIANEYFRGGGQKERLPYFGKKYLLTTAESSFFRILEKATENKYYIFPQIRISNLLYVKADKSDYFRYQSKIKYKSVDFVLTDKNYLNPLLAIELDDSTHNRTDRMDRDDFVDDAFKDAGFPLLRVRNSVSYDIQKLKAQIEELIIGKKDIKELGRKIIDRWEKNHETSEDLLANEAKNRVREISKDLAEVAEKYDKLSPEDKAKVHSDSDVRNIKNKP